MTVSKEEIHALKDYFVNDLYGTVRQEQTEDESYYNDTFDVSEIKVPHKPLRSGLARKIIDSPAEQMITRNPKVFVDIKNQESLKSISKVTNFWVDILRRQNPNPFKESVKNPLLRGETYIFLQHNEALVTNEPTKNKLPVFFIVPDPSTIYGSVEEDEDGIPDKVIIVCERNLSDIKFLYPKWSNPKNNGDTTGKKKVQWLAYWDSEYRYYEADGESVLEGDGENVYGFTPFIRRYSGFGRRDSQNNLASMIVGELRGSRGLLKEECLVRSDIASSLHLYAHPRKELIVPDTSSVDAAKIKEAYSFEPGSLSVLGLPVGSEFSKDTQMTPVPEVFAHLAKIQSDIIGRHPIVMAGMMNGTSGRQIDINTKETMTRYDTILENTETLFSTAIEKAFEICRKIDYTPEGLNKEDISKEFHVTVELKAEDVLERDRLVTLGERLWMGGNGSIDLTTLHTKYYGYTQSESLDIQANMLVDKLTLQNPDVAQVMGMVFAEESGMSGWIEDAQANQAKQEAQQKALKKMPQPGMNPSQEQRTRGETMTQTGFEQIDQSLQNRGARQSPTPYQRGQ
jgi:hypothetical protein